MEIKKIYYYVICLISFFILLWGAVDLTSSALGLATLRKESGVSSVESERGVAADKNDQLFDSYYQSRMLQDRVLDSLARIMIAGLVFGYARKTVAKLEGQA